MREIQCWLTVLAEGKSLANRIEPEPAVNSPKLQKLTSERRQRLDDLARRRGPPAEVDDSITFSEGDGHRGAGF